MKKKFNKKRIFIALFICLIVLCIIIFCGFYLTSKNNQKTEFKKEKVTLNFKDRTLDAINYQYKDYLTIGWLQVEGTNIDYPILSSSAGYNEDVIINFGYRTPYYQSGENRELLLGHNIVNVSSSPIRDMSTLNNFEGLMAFTYEDFAQKNLYISYTKNNVNSIYKIYAVRFDLYESSTEYGYTDKEQLKNYINTVKANSLYDYDVEVTTDDELLTLKTCTRYFGLNGKKAFLVDARKVRENEEITTYQVTKNDNFNELSKGVTNENG